MSLESVKAFFSGTAPDITVMEVKSSTATVPLAAATFGVEEGQIAKTLSLKVGEKRFLLVARGDARLDARLDNAKAKRAFGGKVSMLGADEVVAVTGHPVGGVCPFGLATPLPVYCDIRLRDYAEVLPAAGSTHSAVRLSPDRLAALAGAEWVDVCRDAG